jgi:topoisomerase-4 subunit B
VKFERAGSMAGKQDTPKQYDESSFRVLKGLEPVRERPGMYTRTDSPAHIIQEVIDNAADEALGGFCEEDPRHPAPRRLGHRGRRRPRHSRSACTRWKACRWWCWPSPACTPAASSTSARATPPMRFSGGLHGVGVSVTNALSTRIEVEVVRDGSRSTASVFSGGGEIDQPGAHRGRLRPPEPAPRARLARRQILRRRRACR